MTIRVRRLSALPQTAQLVGTRQDLGGVRCYSHQERGSRHPNTACSSSRNDVSCWMLPISLSVLSNDSPSRARLHSSLGPGSCAPGSVSAVAPISRCSAQMRKVEEWRWSLCERGSTGDHPAVLSSHNIDTSFSLQHSRPSYSSLVTLPAFVHRSLQSSPGPQQSFTCNRSQSHRYPVQQPADPCAGACDHDGDWGAAVRCDASACPSEVDWRFRDIVVGWQCVRMRPSTQ